jgi:hypothetical protein
LRTTAVEPAILNFVPFVSLTKFCLFSQPYFSLFMPDKPRWLNRLPEALATLEASPLPWVERSVLETLLGIRRRRAQQILSALATERRGKRVIVERAVLLAHLRRLAAGDATFYEQRRRERLWQQVAQARRQWMEAPRVLLEPSPQMVRAVYLNDFDGLPEGVEVAPGRITVTFGNAEEALEKLLALALAIGQNRETFEERVAFGL